MTLGQAIDTVRQILGKGCTPETRRRYEIEHAALTDVWHGHPYNDARWNVTEQYVYRDAYLRGATQLQIEGKGEITVTMKEVAR
jgi:hypothetical protein